MNKPLPPLNVSANTLALLKLDPSNPTARALVLQQMGKPIPDDLVTYDAILEWVIATQPALAQVLRVNVRMSQTELGRARYRVPVSGQGDVVLNAETIADIAQASDSPRDFLNRLRDEIAESANDQIQMDDYGDYDYSVDEATDTDDSETAFDTALAVQRAQEILRDNAPDTYRELFGEDEGADDGTF